MIRIILFILGSMLLVYFSRRSFNNTKSHGFYRFFIFEIILLLILLNHPFWFKDPFSLLHLFSWLFLLTSIIFVFQALLLLKRFGGQAERKDMPENHSFENTAQIVKTGLYHSIRHPMYSSLLFLAWGSFCKHITPLTLGLVLLASGLLIVTAKVEEQENIHYFGEMYRDYMQRTKMFIPGIF